MVGPGLSAVTVGMIVVGTNMPLGTVPVAVGNPASDAVGNPGFAVDNPASDAVGNPASDAVGNPASDAVGNPGFAVGNPASDAVGNPVSDLLGNPMSIAVFWRANPRSEVSKVLLVQWGQGGTNEQEQH
jgi:hypothetical protein